jgi:fatty-acyl-CoA synthase
VREQKGPHQAPKKIQVVPDLPKTPAGKIDKKALRRQYWPDRQRQIN